MTGGDEERLDWLFEAATVVDGSGAPRFEADVGVRGGRIVCVDRSDLGARSARRAVQHVRAQGLVLAPGFIDAHAHDDAALFDPPRMHPKLSQGVTTVIVGHCGLSLAPLVADQVPAPLDLLGTGVFRHPSMAHYLAALEDGALPLHVAALIGHTSLRVAHVAALDAPATAAERRVMARQVQDALDAGAWGVSTGVFYPPARAADAAEIVDVCRPMSGSGALLSVHLRDEGEHIDAALTEALDVGLRLAVRTVISHHKLVGPRNHGRAVHTLARLRAQRRLQPVCQDCYPYRASSTMLDPSRVALAERVLISSSQPCPELAGQELGTVAAGWGVTREAAAVRLMPGRAVYFSMHADDVRHILSDDETMVGSDGLPYDSAPHPRLWGSFARMLALSRGTGAAAPLMGLEAAVHRMSGLTAARYGLTGRGRIATGAAADLVLFDPHTVQDRARYRAPVQPAAGIRGVWVAGALAWDADGPTGRCAGQVLRRAPTRRGD